MSRSSLGRRLLAASAASVLFVGAAVAIDRGGPADAAGDPAQEPSIAPSTAPSDDPEARGPTGASPPAEPPPDVDAALALLEDVDAAADASGDELLAAGLTLAQGPWRDLTDVAAWPVRRERPVYVGELIVRDRSRVEADVVIAFRPDETESEIVLRLLPAAGSLVANGLVASAEQDGRPVEAVAEDGGLLRVQLPQPVGPGGAVSLRVRVAYDLLTVAQVAGRSGPAAFGIHNRTATQAVLGHWAPLLTFETDDIVPWGDVGAFPTAIWSVVIHHDADAVTGGAETDCPATVEAPEDPTGTDACTWARGVALRDLAVVVHPVVTEIRGEVKGIDVRTTASTDAGRAAAEGANAEAIIGVQTLTDLWGPLAWRDLEVVAVPLGNGAAGMEFPGLVLVDDSSARDLAGGFGSYVLAHEVGHQWFHALVGNGSFGDAVVDESLAQYASILIYRSLFGPAAGDQLTRTAIADRYRRFLDSGLADAEIPPASSVEEFTSSRTYGPLIYARSSLAWIAAEEIVGEDVVQRFLRDLVLDEGLGEVTADEVIRRAVAVDERFGQILSLYWEAEGPVPVP